MLSIIVSTRGNRIRELKRLFLSLRKINRGDNLEFILVDQNEKNQSLKTLLDSFQKRLKLRTIYVKDGGIGLSRGRNIGIKKAKGDWFMFLDDDAVIDNFSQEDFLILEKNKLKKIIYYGNVLNLENRKSYIKRRILTRKVHLWNFDSICSIGLLFSRKAIEEIGFFDEDFGAGSKFGAAEESDMLIRALKKGVEINYLKNLIVLHPEAKISIEKKYSYGYGIGALYRKHIFDSFPTLLCLGFKFILEIKLRLLAAIFFFFRSKKQHAKAHLQYLKGFLKGFTSYHKIKYAGFRNC